MDSLLIPFLISGLIAPLISVLICLAYLKEQKRLENIVFRLESLSKERSLQLRRLRRFSRLNLYSNIHRLRELDREITSIEHKSNIHTSYRLRRLTLSASQILDNMENRIGKIEETLAASL